MNNYKIAIPKQIVFLTIFVSILILGYTVWSDSSYFIYLLWNIFLAFLPFLISAGLLWYKNREKTYLIVFIVGLFAWLILFPNAPYLVTDIIHLGANQIVPFWLDVIILFSSAWIGIYLGIYSLSHIEKILLTWCNQKNTNIIILVTILISSFGIYMGRFLRWNSWDIFIQPGVVFKDIFVVLSDIVYYKEAYITTIIFFIFITVFYGVWRYVRKQIK